MSDSSPNGRNVLASEGRPGSIRHPSAKGTRSMANRLLTNGEREQLAPLLDEVRKRLRELSGSDEELYWAFRRRLFNQLQYDERLKPPYRAALKKKKRVQQRGLCNICKAPLPESGAVLDRFEGMKGYTLENTQLLCQTCDTEKQRQLKYR